jgi:UDP-glucose 4-epimerase
MRLAGAAVLVTGGAGFIGSHLVDHLIDRGVSRLVVVDTLWLGREGHLASARTRRPDLEFVKEDAGDGDAMRTIIERRGIDVVFNLATKPLGYSFTDPRGAYMTSVDIAANFAELLRAGAFGRLVHYSTSEIYGDAQTVPMSEDHPVRPTTPYAAGKLAADVLLQSWAQLFSIPVLTIRPFNNYGPRQNDRDYGAVIPVTIRRLTSGLPPILEGTGDQTRDFTFVKDTVRLTADLCESDAAWGQTVNVAAASEVSIRDLIGAICGAMGYTGEIEQRPPRPGDHRRHLASTERARRLVPFGDLTPLDAGIAETVAWYRAHERTDSGHA